MTGTVLGNRYELVEKIGMGGMAIVYKALDKLLNRYVAVKLLRSEFEGNEEFIRRFNIESQAAASLSHPNIVPIYDVGQSGTTQYIVMEYLEGKTLKQYIAEKKGDIPWREAADISMQICSALEHAHSKHIIHRDIKPQNIIINSDGTIKVTDFGIARAANNVTTTTEAVGSAHYLSPEQARGGYTDQRSDIYSLGVVMYELFTGKLPFDGESPVAVAMQHMQREPVPPKNIRPDIPQPIEDIILKAMSKEQRLRYESAEQMLLDIKKAYADPEAEIADENIDNSDRFGTRVISPIVSINMPNDNAQEKTERKVVRRAPEEERDVRKTKKVSDKKRKKENAVAVVAAVVTCLILAAILGVMTANVIGRRNSAKPGEYRVPNLLNLDLEQAQNAVKDTEFTIAIERKENSPTVPEGSIISQTPEARELLDEPCEIKLVVSLGVATFRLEDYTGQDYNRVQEILTGENYGLRVNINMENSDGIPSGIIIRHLPTQGTQMQTGDAITLYVSEGPSEDLVKVPSVIGLDETVAKASIASSGLVLGDVIPIESDSKKGLVVNQSLVNDTTVARGTVMDIFVSTGGEAQGAQQGGQNAAPEPEQSAPEGNNAPEQNENVPQTSANGL